MFMMKGLANPISSLAVNPVHSPYATNGDYHPALGSLPCADQGP